jgi:superfamily II DNA or RNA helicase
MIRPYQEEAIRATLSSLVEHDRVLCVLATGAGKTVIAGQIARDLIASGPILFLADAQQLVYQAAEKLGHWAQCIPAVEMAESHADPGDRLVVATTQSIARRLSKWPRNYFRLIIVDEAHRNTLGQQAATVLGHFSEAQVIGLTATPYRSDRKQLGSYYQHIACEIGLGRLIREGWLSRIVVRCVPCDVDLSGVRTSGGDYRDDDLGERISPHIDALARLLKEHASDRRTVVFTPLIQTAKDFAEACNRIGLRATYASGEERDGVSAFARREVDVIANAALLTTGWDQPDVDCVYILRPTRSQVLFSQMVGRGTRTHPGKDHLLLLDPLFLSDDMQLIRPARLIAQTPEEAASIERRIRAGDTDLMVADDNARADREEAMRKKAEEAARKKRKEFDPVEFALSIASEELANYEPQTFYESAPPTEKQLQVLRNLGFAVEEVKSKGFASRLIDAIFRRRDERLATPKQLRWLIRLGHPNPRGATFAEASAFLDRRFRKKTTITI